MWLIMGIEQPILNAVMARLPEATRHLAAFEVTWALVLLIESPILQMLAAATAMVRGAASYRRWLVYMHLWAAGLTVLHLVVSLPVIFYPLVGRVLGAPPQVVTAAHQVFLLLIPFSALVGYRRFWQGTLIRMGHTGLVGRTMVIRLAATVAPMALGLVGHHRGWPRVPGGHLVAAGGLLAGVTAGALAAWWYCRTAVVSRFTAAASGTATLDTRDSFASMSAFYIPLSLTSIVSLASRPLMAYGIGRSVLPLQSLAAWPVVQSFLFLFTSLAMSYQEAVVAQAGLNRQNRPALATFARRLIGVLTAVLLLMVLTGGTRWWFSVVAGLTPELAGPAQAAIVVLVAMPALVTARAYFGGLLVVRRQTVALSLAVVSGALVLTALVVALPRVPTLIGTVVAAIAFTSAYLVQVAVLSMTHGALLETHHHVNS